MAEGWLVQVLPKWLPRNEIIHAVFASRRGLLPAVQVLIDFISTHFNHS